MAPKKKKITSTTLVLGTVSTRSTRRESVVKFGGIEKSSVSVKNATDLHGEFAEQTCSISDLPQTNTKVLELLHDWSDEDGNSQSSLISLDKNDNKNSQLHDKQCLIDILEGNTDEQCELKSQNIQLDNGTILKSTPLETIIENGEVVQEYIIQDNSVFMGNVTEITVNKNNEIQKSPFSGIVEIQNGDITNSVSDSRNIEANLEKIISTCMLDNKNNIHNSVIINEKISNNQSSVAEIKEMSSVQSIKKSNSKETPIRRQVIMHTKEQQRMDEIKSLNLETTVDNITKNVHNSNKDETVDKSKCTSNLQSTNNSYPDGTTVICTQTSQEVPSLLNISEHMKLPAKLKFKRTARANLFTRRKGSRNKIDPFINVKKPPKVIPTNDNLNQEVKEKSDLPVRRNVDSPIQKQEQKLEPINVPVTKDESTNTLKGRKRSKKIYKPMNADSIAETIEAVIVLDTDSNSNTTESDTGTSTETGNGTNKDVSNITNVLTNGGTELQNLMSTNFESKDLNGIVTTETAAAAASIDLIAPNDIEVTSKNENKIVKGKGKKRAPRKPKETTDENQKKPKGRKKPKNVDKPPDVPDEVRRSDRIRTMPIKKPSSVVMPDIGEINTGQGNQQQSETTDKTSDGGVTLSNKKEKSKNKNRSMELDPSSNSDSVEDANHLEMVKPINLEAQAEIRARLKTFIHLKENQYKTDRTYCKEVRDMVCICGDDGTVKRPYECRDDCLNRMLLIECGPQCPVGERCTNRRFQKGEFAPVEVFKTEKKGLGIRAAANIPYGEFILEYVGEVVDKAEFDKRAEVYSQDNNAHFYFMSLGRDAVIDATMKGNISRFMNHSCEPNAETEKWTVNGEIRIGFFSSRTILAGEEITFDYRFQRYGKEAQRCYCETESCSGWLGAEPDETDEEEDDDEEEVKEIEMSPKVLSQQDKVSKGRNKEKVVDLDDETISAVSGEELETTAATTTTPATTKTKKKRTYTKRNRKDTLLYEDFDQLDADIGALLTTGLKNQNHTLKLCRVMVKAKELEQRKKLLHVLRRAELPCRRLFLDYHGLRLMHGYMIDVQQLLPDESMNFNLCRLQAKLELLQTLAVLPIQNKTILIESKILATVEKWANNELMEDDEEKEDIRISKSMESANICSISSLADKSNEVLFLAKKLIDDWSNLKENFRIPKKQRIEEMKEHEKEANRKFMDSNYGSDHEHSRKHDSRQRLTSQRYKSVRKTKSEERDKPSAAYLQLSKNERRKLFALQMEIKEEERKKQQREIWQQHEMNCMLIGADPRFTAPFDPDKGLRNVWVPGLGQWHTQTIPESNISNQGLYTAPMTLSPNFNVPSVSNAPFLNTYQPINLPHSNSNPFPGIQPNMIPNIPPPPVLPPPICGIPLTPIPIAIHQSESIPGPSNQGLQVMYEFAGYVSYASPKSKSMKPAYDRFGRPYYYDPNTRISTWIPPVDEPMELSDTSSESIASPDYSLTESEDEINDDKLFSALQKRLGSTKKIIDLLKSLNAEKPDSKESDGNASQEMPSQVNSPQILQQAACSSSSTIDSRLKEQFDVNDVAGFPPQKKKKTPLCEEIMISPRTEQDQIEAKANGRRIKALKEKLRRHKQQTGSGKKKVKLIYDKKLKEKRSKTTKCQPNETGESSEKHVKESEDDRKAKEAFRSQISATVVNVLNAYRKPDCTGARIESTEDFKHIARKLTHFIMLKELKHVDNSTKSLQCSDSVKAKAREYIRKYMIKYETVYQKKSEDGIKDVE